MPNTLAFERALFTRCPTANGRHDMRIAWDIVAGNRNDHGGHAGIGMAPVVWCHSTCVVVPARRTPYGMERRTPPLRNAPPAMIALSSAGSNAGFPVDPVSW
jgi:hypothetical protein